MKKETSQKVSSFLESDPASISNSITNITSLSSKISKNKKYIVNKEKWLANKEIWLTNFKTSKVKETKAKPSLKLKNSIKIKKTKN